MAILSRAMLASLVVLLAARLAPGASGDVATMGMGPGGERGIVVSSASTVVLDGRTINVSIAAYQDWMPIVGPQPRALNVLVTLTTSDPRGFPRGLAIGPARLRWGLQRLVAPIGPIPTALPPPNTMYFGGRAWGGWSLGSTIQAQLELRVGRQRARVSTTTPIGAVF